MATKNGYAYGTSTAEPVVPNTGKPVVGGNMAWAKGLRQQKLIRVHLVGKDGWTACRALSYSESPYLKSGGHVAYATSAAVTCVPCKRITPKVSKPRAARKPKTVTPATTEA